MLRIMTNNGTNFRLFFMLNVVYAESTMMSVSNKFTMLSVIMLNVVMLNVIMLIVVAPSAALPSALKRMTVEANLN